MDERIQKYKDLKDSVKDTELKKSIQKKIEKLVKNNTIKK